MALIDDFHKAFEQAEEEIKFAEMSLGGLASIEDDECNPPNEPRGVVVPSINELRYAAKHLSNAMRQGISEADRDEQIRRAIRHCVRAKLDALKAVILFLSRDFYSFTRDYRLLNIPHKDREILNGHQAKIVKILRSLSKDHSKTSEAECKRLKKSIGELYAIYLDAKDRRTSYNEMKEKIDSLHVKTDKHDKSTLFQWIVGIWLAAISVVLGVIALK